MAASCPNGHDSEWDDYCSVCGEQIGASGEASSEASSETPDASGSPGGIGGAGGSEAGSLAEAGAACPHCAEPHAAGDVFCENCGYDFLAGTLPDEAAVAPPVGDVAASNAGGVANGAGVAVVSVDLGFFERMHFSGVEPPGVVPEPVRIDLPPTDILVGRHSESRGTFPEIDLSKLFAGDAIDPAVSSNHCRFHRSKHGWTVTDLDSTNGTFLADSDEPLAPGTPISLTPGTPVFVGAWTRIELLDA